MIISDKPPNISLPLSKENPSKIYDLLTDTQTTVESKWFVSDTSKLLFHQVDFIKKWSKKAGQIAEAEGYPIEKKHAIQLIIWFYSLSYLNWEATAIKGFVHSFPNLEEYEALEFKLLQGIAFLKSGQSPQSDVEQVLHDSYWSFVGYKKFTRLATLWRLEKEMLQEQPYADNQWTEFLLNQLLAIRFYTAFAQKKYNSRRLKHIAQLRNQQSRVHVQVEKKQSGKNLGRGIDTLFRINFNNHINLSRIADGKANIMISINTILLSVLVTLGSAGFPISSIQIRANWFNYIPIALLLATCLVSLVFAILATRPKITMKPVHKQRNSNLLFFGNFLQVKKETFVDHLSRLKMDQGALYDSLSKDLYNLGVILKKKYELLTWAYNAFCVGIILTVLAFLFVLLSS